MLAALTGADDPLGGEDAAAKGAAGYAGQRPGTNRKLSGGHRERSVSAIPQADGGFLQGVWYH